MHLLVWALFHIGVVAVLGLDVVRRPASSHRAVISEGLLIRLAVCCEQQTFLWYFRGFALLAHWDYSALFAISA